ncbi:MAG: alpha/beta hydrolase [Bacteroidota bacterium]
MKRFVKISIGVVLGLCLLMGGYALFFFQTEEAPFLQGKVLFSLPYHGELTLDVYQPTQQVYVRAPVLVYIHGGAWITGGKGSVNNARFNEAFNQLRNQGYAIVSPNYTLARLGNPPFPACLTDGFVALQWIEDHADSLGLDLNNVGLIGESAGGHIAQVLAYMDGAEFGANPEVPIRYLIDVYGPTDLGKLYRDQVPLIDSLRSMTARLPERWQKCLDVTRYLFGFDPTTDSIRAEQFAYAYSPFYHVGPQAPPTLLIHGEADRLVPFSQSEILQGRLDDLGVSHQLHPLPGVDHAFREATEAQKAEVQRWITEFVLAHYQGEQPLPHAAINSTARFPSRIAIFEHGIVPHLHCQSAL